MKVAYVSRWHYGSSRVVLTDRTLDVVAEAAMEVAKLSIKNIGNPNIDYLIPRAKGQLHAEGVLVNISKADSPDTGRRHERPSIIQGVPINAKLAEYGPENMDILTNYDVLGMPQVSFSHMFLYYLVECDIVNGNPDVVAREHWPILAPLVRIEAKENYARAKKNIRGLREDGISIKKVIGDFEKHIAKLRETYEKNDKLDVEIRVKFKNFLDLIERPTERYRDSADLNVKEESESLVKRVDYFEDIIARSSQFSETGRGLDKLISALKSKPS